TLAQEARQEDRDFKDPAGKWQITLKDNWEPTVYQDGAGNTVVDIIYDHREEGILRIRPLVVDSETGAETLAIREEERANRFRPGFVKGKLEPFSGKLDGIVQNFDFTTGGRRKSARYYFLRASDTLYYALRFEGRPEVLRSHRNRTDLMARSFRPLP
ncbi:MAG: hypothetical protein HY650_14550, partial [Acidobacteria bacterium]|nr:hypothetical protein [Acidobacteriota bacterium]